MNVSYLVKMVKGGVKKFAAVDGTLNIGVYNENVANLTFLSDFELTHKVYGVTYSQ